MDLLNPMHLQSELKEIDTVSLGAVEVYAHGKGERIINEALEQAIRFIRLLRSILGKAKTIGISSSA